MKKAKDTFFFIPHTHWEGAVFKTREEYLEMGLPIILRALRLLRKHSHYRFVLDQSCYVQPFLERYPEEEATFRSLIAEGRLAIAGGLYVMPDVNMPCGESFIRQIIYGKGYFRRQLGVDVTTGWQLDTFGHHPQMPQLLRLAGYTSFWSQRGVLADDTPSEFFWEGLDGTQIPFYWTPCSYANTYGSPGTIREFSEFMRSKYHDLDRYTRGTGRAGLAGADVCLPEEHVPLLAEAFNRQPDRPFDLRIGLPCDYEAMVEARPERRPVVKGDLNPIFQGTYSSRIEIKQRTRELERLLTAAEKLGAILGAAGETVANEMLWRAWEPMLFNQTHDLMSGVMTDHVYLDTLRLFDVSRNLADEEFQTRWRGLTDLIDTQGDGVPVVVFNPLGWMRTDAVFASAGFSGETVAGVELLGPDGTPTPVQIVEAEKSDHGSLLRVKFAFLARDVPALGYSVYYLRPLNVVAATETALASAPVAVPENVMENACCRLELDLASGAITRLVDKRTGWNVLAGAGNVVAREEDRGDFWELYRPLGMGFVTAKEPHLPPQPGQAVFSTEQAGAPGTVTRGPVYSEFTVAHPFGERGRFQTTIRLYAGLPRVEISTRILNHDAHVRYRVLFPTSLAQGRSVHEIPFGAIERPDGVECPAQSWIDHSDGDTGVALLNRGLPGNNVSGGTMMLSLMRSTQIVSYGLSGGYEGQNSSSGLELGKELTFDYALLPHAGDWRRAAVYQSGHEFNHPLVAATAAAHPGRLPRRWGFLELSHPNVMVSALKTAEDGHGAVLRIYETTGAAVAGARIKFAPAITSAVEVNLMEDPIRELAVGTDNTVQVGLRPFEIKTIRLCRGERRPS